MQCLNSCGPSTVTYHLVVLVKGLTSRVHLVPVVWLHSKDWASWCLCPLQIPGGRPVPRSILCIQCSVLPVFQRPATPKLLQPKQGILGHANKDATNRAMKDGSLSDRAILVHLSNQQRRRSNKLQAVGFNDWTTATNRHAIHPTATGAQPIACSMQNQTQGAPMGRRNCLLHSSQQ